MWIVTDTIFPIIIYTIDNPLKRGISLRTAVVYKSEHLALVFPSKRARKKAIKTALIRRNAVVFDKQEEYL